MLYGMFQQNTLIVKCSTFHVYKQSTIQHFKFQILKLPNCSQLQFQIITYSVFKLTHCQIPTKQQYQTICFIVKSNNNSQLYVLCNCHDVVVHRSASIWEHEKRKVATQTILYTKIQECPIPESCVGLFITLCTEWILTQRTRKHMLDKHIKHTTETIE